MGECDQEAVRGAVADMVVRVQAYVPGYRLEQQVQFTALSADESLHVLLRDVPAVDRVQVSVFLEVEGAAHYLPAYAGNLDIMTSAAVRVAERIARAWPGGGRRAPGRNPSHVPTALLGSTS